MISGAGAAGVAIAKILLEAGIGDVAVADRKGIVSADRDDLTDVKRGARRADQQGRARPARWRPRWPARTSSSASPAARSRRRRWPRWRRTRSSSPWPTRTRRSTRTSRTSTRRSWPPGASDFPNQINNVLAFPGIFAGALQVRASRITEGMKIAAAERAGRLSSGDELAADYVIPSPFDERVAPAVTAAVAAAARAEGVARRWL